MRLMGRAADDLWTEGRNVRIDIRWGAGDAEQMPRTRILFLSLPTRGWL